MRYQEFHTLQSTLERSAFCQLVKRDELEVLEITHPAFRAEIVLQGAQMIAFAPTGERNWLWLSDTVAYKKGVSLRGGIPVCWPWFGNASKNPPEVQAAIASEQPAPAHGFARNRTWQFGGVYEAADRVELTLTLKASPSSQTYWQGEAEVTAHWVMTATGMTLSLTTKNTGRSSLAITQALHSYFPTSDVHKTRLAGLARNSYLDTLDGWRRKTQQGDVLFSGETDRIYYTGPNNHRLLLNTPERALEITAEGSQSCIVWNPWIKKAKHLGQFANDAWQSMVCAETANAADNWVSIDPGTSHTLSVTLTQRQGALSII